MLCNVFVDVPAQLRKVPISQQHATLLGPTRCVRLHGTTTMLAPVKVLGPLKRTQHFWPTTRNTSVCMDLNIKLQPWCTDYAIAPLIRKASI